MGPWCYSDWIENLNGHGAVSNSSLYHCFYDVLITEILFHIPLGFHQYYSVTLSGYCGKYLVFVTTTSMPAF